MKRYHMVFDRRTGQTKTEVIPDGVDARAFLEQAMHDCPDCRALRAQGEPPGKIVDVVPAKRDIIRGRRPRWRKLKRAMGR